jgi:hypothetical protein
MANWLRILKWVSLVFIASGNGNGFKIIQGSQSGCCLSQRTLRVLVTGFLPFFGREFNPAGDTASSLNGKCVELLETGSCFTIEGIVIPTSEAGAKEGERILHITSNSVDNQKNTSYGKMTSKFAAIIHIGELLRSTMHKIHVETNAVNVLTCGPECKKTSNGEERLPIFPQQQILLPSTADLSAIWLDNKRAIFHQNAGVSVELP